MDYLIRYVAYSQLDNLLCACKFEIIIILHASEIHCFHIKWARQYLHNRSKSSGCLCFSYLKRSAACFVGVNCQRHRFALVLNLDEAVMESGNSDQKCILPSQVHNEKELFLHFSSCVRIHWRQTKIFGEDISQRAAKCNWFRSLCGTSIRDRSSSKDR